MKINEIEIGTRVSMSFIIDGKDIRIFGEVVPKDMMTELFGIWSDFEAAMIPACIVRVEDAKSLKDGIDYVADTLLAPKEWLTYLWEYVDGRKFERDGQTYLYMATPKYGLQFNRRGNLRVRVDKKSEIHFHENMVHDIIIKDISENGIGFYVSNDICLEIGERCQIVLEQLEGTEDPIPQRMKECSEIEVEVVRVAGGPNDMRLYGGVVTS